MAKFNQAAKAKGRTSPVTAQPAVARTHEGADAQPLDARGELYTLFATNLVGESTFYESADARDTRFRNLVRKAALADFDWLAAMLVWGRSSGNLRSAPLVGAAEAVHERLDAGLHGGNRQLVAKVLQRADEPGEFIAYWTHRFGMGKPLPEPVKRGLSDAMERLYNQVSYAKYDSESARVGPGLAVRLAHAKPTGAQQELYRYMVGKQRGRDVSTDGLPALAAREALARVPQAERRAFIGTPEHTELMRASGYTWEALSGWLGGKLDAEVWESVIPNMGYMALLRNLRNFDQAGISEQARGTVLARLIDIDAVAKSRQMPFRFYSAYRNVPSLHWQSALECALTYSLRNIPELPGSTLVLVDTSASMRHHLSEKSEVQGVDVATLFGVALALKPGMKARRGDGPTVDLHGFATGTFEHRVPLGGAVLKEVEKFRARIGEAGHGTQVYEAVARTYDGHDRVVIISDMQTAPMLSNAEEMSDRMYDRGTYGKRIVPADVPVYAFDTKGYGTSIVGAGEPNRHQFGSLSDAAFTVMKALESGRDAGWPWEEEARTSSVAENRRAMGMDG